MTTTVNHRNGSRRAQLAEVRQRLDNTRARRRQAQACSMPRMRQATTWQRRLPVMTSRMHVPPSRPMRHSSGWCSVRWPASAGCRARRRSLIPRTRLAQLERFSTSSAPIGRVELGEYMSAEDATGLTGKALAAAGMVDPTPGMTTGPFGPIIGAPAPPTSFLDLCPSQMLDVPSLPYAQEVVTGDRTAGARRPCRVKSRHRRRFRTSIRRPSRKRSLPGPRSTSRRSPTSTSCRRRSPIA